MDDGFYNLQNEYVTVDSIKETLIGYYQELHATDKTKVNDFNEGSEIMNFIGLLSVLSYNMLYEQNSTLGNYFVNTAEGEYLDLIGANPNINLERMQGSNASGFVKFTIAEPALSEVEIPEGTVVSNGYSSYGVVGDNYISVGETYTYCPVECEVEGIEGNCSVGSITECEDPQFTVTNEDAFTNGYDFEDDEEYRTRLLEFLRADNFGSIGYYQNILYNYGVHDLLQYSGTTVLSWVLNIPTNETSTYNEILSHFNDANNFVVGHDFTFLLPDKLNTSFTLTVDGDCNVTETDLQEFCNKYWIGGSLTNVVLDLPGYNINSTVTINKFISDLKQAFETITTAEVSDISFTINSGSTEYSGDDFDDLPSALGAYYVYRGGTVTVVVE